MAEIRWTAEAQRWLEDIFEYVAADNPQAAGRTVQVIHERAQDLVSFPENPPDADDVGSARLIGNYKDFPAGAMLLMEGRTASL